MTISITGHPRAQRGVRRARAAAGLAGFLVAALMAHRASLPTFDVLVRALAAGIIAHVVAWRLAVAYWRAAILAELETARRKRHAVREDAERVLRQAAATMPQR